MVPVVKNPPSNAGRISDAGLIPEGMAMAQQCPPAFLPGECHGAWRARVHRVAKSQTEVT